MGKDKEYQRKLGIKVWKPIAGFPTECKQCLASLKNGMYKVCDKCMSKDSKPKQGG